jgi:hypothetical protein
MTMAWIEDTRRAAEVVPLDTWKTGTGRDILQFNSPRAESRVVRRGTFAAHPVSNDA